MTFLVTTALAPTFAWTASMLDFRMTFAGDPEIGVLVPSGTYRMHLGPSSGAGADFIRTLEAAINATLVAGGRSETVTLTMRADGRVKFGIDGAVSLADSPALRALGIDPGGPSLEFTGTRAPQHLALIVSASGGVWEDVQVASIATDGAGVPYSLGAITTAQKRTLGLDLIPWDPDAATDAESPATPWYAARAYWGARGDATVGRVWSWRDVLREACNVECAAALWSWQSLLASTSVPYDLVRVGEASIRNPKPERRHATWSRYVTHQLELWLPAGAPMGTRA